MVTNLSIDGIHIYDSNSINREFTKYFSTIGSKLASKIDTPTDKAIKSYIGKIDPNPNTLFLSPCTAEELCNTIKKLKNKSSSGFDCISNILLKKIAPEIITPMCTIFNNSLVSGIFPSSMKYAEVIPLYKGRIASLLTNYRPISLLITISKVLEKIMYCRVYNFLDKNEIFYQSQYGFRSNHSCEMAITELVGNILKGKNNNKHTIAVFIDLSKAFDTISHDILLSKLHKYGIRGVSNALV